MSDFENKKQNIGWFLTISIALTILISYWFNSQIDKMVIIFYCLIGFIGLIGVVESYIIYFTSKTNEYNLAFLDVQDENEHPLSKKLTGVWRYAPHVLLAVTFVCFIFTTNSVVYPVPNIGLATVSEANITIVGFIIPLLEDLFF